MRTLNIVAMLILVLGGLELGLLGFMNFDTLGVVLGVDGARVIEGIAGVAAIYGIFLIAVVARRSNEPFAQMHFREPAVSFGELDRRGVRITVVR